MSEDKNYKLILLGKLAEGVDPTEVKEKLAIIFDKSEKKIEKLFKKKPEPVVIRKNLAEDIALRYKTGLERIGVICNIQDDRIIQKSSGVPVLKSAPRGALRITHIKMPLGALTLFLLKWVLASIPAFLILGVLIIIMMKILGGIFAVV